MELVDVAGPIGVEVRGVDLHEPLDDESVAPLRDAFDRRHLLLFRAQEISGDEQVRLCRHFGPIAREGAEEHGLVSNTDPGGILREGALPFHSDFAFTHEPVRALSLYALVVPEGGAPTVFADAVGVLDRVPTALRLELDHRSVVNVYDFSGPTDRRMRERDLPPGSPIVERPLVGEHRLLGVPVVNANAMHTDRIVGLPEPESEALLAELFAHLYAPENTFVLDWTVGDVAVWDNLALQHHRPAFPHAAPRSMQRVCINEKTSHQLVPNMAQLIRA
jgi:taurine dioxygenase